MTAVDWAIETALRYLGKPYIWGGDDPSGFDCSGFVLECLKTAGVVAEDFDTSADGLLKKFHDKTLLLPKRGALLLSVGPNEAAYHVVLCLDDQFQIGASSGTHNTTDAGKAWKDNAYVKIRPINFNIVKHRLVFPFQEN